MAMRPDVDRYKSFYKSQLGLAVARLIGRQVINQLNSSSPSIKGKQTALLGYGVPYADQLIDKHMDVHLLMPGNQGAHGWQASIETRPDPRPGCRVAMVDEDHLPLADCSLDTLILVHALEHVSRPNRFLRELWRVLKPGGFITLIVPNRRSSWAAFETTPFAYGRPWSRRQLHRFLQDHLFTPREAKTALMLPPLLVPALAGLMEPIERPFRAIDARFGGVLIITAEKEMMGGVPLGKTQKVAEPVGVTSDRSLPNSNQSRPKTRT